MPEKLTNDRLPAGQYLTRETPVMHVGSIPNFDRETWDFRLYGLVETPLTLSYSEFLSLPRTERRSDLHCVATWSRRDIGWEGIPVSLLVRRARPLLEAKYVLIHADGGYTANLPIEVILEENVLIADRMDGEPLKREHGYPARLVVPGRYAWKSAKWVRAIEFLAEDRPGFWEMRGYSTTADPTSEDRFAE